jgi:hypothetical protein
MTDEQKVREAFQQWHDDPSHDSGPRDAWEAWQAAVAWMGGEGEAVAWIYAHEVDVLRERSNNVVAAAIHPQSELPADAVKLYTHPPRADADARDAARYRWLREGHPGTYNTIMIHAGAQLDQAIDQALAAERGDQ